MEVFATGNSFVFQALAQVRGNKVWSLSIHSGLSYWDGMV